MDANLLHGAAAASKQRSNRSQEEAGYVDLSPEWREELLDPEGWDTVLDTLAITMRVAIALTDTKGRPVGKCHNPQPAWLLAHGANPRPDGACTFCLEAHPACKAIEDALRTNSVVTVQDPAGLTHVAVPLSLGGQQLGALIAGQVFTHYPQPLPLQRVARERGISRQELWEKAIQHVPVARATLQLYANLLMSLGQAFLGQRYAGILQRKLAQTSERYRLFFDGVKDYALLTVDRSGRITSWNSGAQRLFGYLEGEIMGQFASCLAAPESVQGEQLQRYMSDADRSGWSEWEDWRVRKDSTRFLGACALASMGKEGAREYGILIRNVTENRRTEQELQQAQKLEGIGVLAGGIAHDFNNLLTGIMLSLNLMKDGLSPDDPKYPLLEIAEGSSVRAAELVDQMLTYAGKGTFVVTRFDFSALVLELLPLISASIPKNVELDLSIQPGLPWIEADASQIRQVVMNVIINGAEAIGAETGTVWVSTGISDSGASVFMKVKDSGSGMSEATRAKMFDPFFTTKFTGRGLGLAAVSGIVRGHKGKMQVDSDPGLGTTFTVSFPALQAEAVEQVDAPPTVGARGEGTILVVDDEAKLRQLADIILKHFGYSVLLAKDGREAVEVFRQNAAKISVVLLDMAMPVMGGQKAFGLIRAINPDVPVIVASGYSESIAREELGTGVIAGFIQKPFSASKLLESIQAAL